MKMFTCNYLTGHTFGIEFTNGNMAVYVGKLDSEGKPTAFATKSGANKAKEKFRTIKGDNWENGNLNYKSWSLVNGEMVEKTEFVHRSATY